MLIKLLVFICNVPTLICHEDAAKMVIIVDHCETKQQVLLSIS